MLSKKYRLTKNGSFNYVYRKGSSASAKLISLTYVLSKGTARVGFSVPNKVGKAVIRGRLKRRMRAIMRAEADRLIGVQLVFGAKTGAAELGFYEVKAIMLGLLERAKLLRASTN